MKTEYSSLRKKEVINVKDGARLGHIQDMVIDTEKAKVLGLILPGEKSFTFFKSPDSIYVPWKNIDKIGLDVILLNLDMSECKVLGEQETLTEEKV